MEQPQSPGLAPATVAPMLFAARPPSQTWEQVPMAVCPPHFLWVWFKPPAVPQGLIVRIPDEVYQDGGQLAAQLTMRQILLAAGVDPATAASWLLFGAAYDAAGGTSPYLDAPIPAAPAGVDPSITVYVNMPAIAIQPIPVMQPVPQMQMAAAPDQPEAKSRAPQTVSEIFDRIDSDWRMSQDIEKELKRQRKRLAEMFAKLKSLNRDLSPLERLHSDAQDKRDWRDARRALRDCSTRVWGCMKSFDIGDTSSAGRKNGLEQTYNQMIAPRREFPRLEQTQRDFESYRKAMATLQSTMNTALSMAATQGERRAQGLLNRIGAKIRDAQTKRNFLGIIAD